MKEGTNEADHCLLTQMVRANIKHENLLTDRELLSNAFGMGVGGNDSTASALTSVLFMLAQNPQAQEKLFQELVHVGYSDSKDLKKLGYLVSSRE